MQIKRAREHAPAGLFGGVLPRRCYILISNHFAIAARFRWEQNRKIKSPNVGLEPTTPRLRVSCSTDWASQATCNHEIEHAIWLRWLALIWDISGDVMVFPYVGQGPRFIFCDFLGTTLVALIMFLFVCGNASLKCKPWGLCDLCQSQKYFLNVRELNPGLPRDRRGYSPLY